METFNFCPNTLVPEMLPREQGSVVSMGGWTFTAKPTTPFVKSWNLTLHGLYWRLDEFDIFDASDRPETNAKALEEFYQRHELWAPFEWAHPHAGQTTEYRFKAPVVVPKALTNSGGLIEPFQIQLIEHNPGYV